MYPQRKLFSTFSVCLLYNSYFRYHDAINARTIATKSVDRKLLARAGQTSPTIICSKLLTSSPTWEPERNGKNWPIINIWPCCAFLNRWSIYEIYYWCNGLQITAIPEHLTEQVHITLALHKIRMSTLFNELKF